ncbi:hypothetical protein HHI36_014577 [Cryptolaemus montrouzieri]|uniref:Uncharacterized protein n=1 Tax=Cryptolaemus montrouzieri TaxID=559131 RepID=A0ABD2N365_9CUCU
MWPNIFSKFITLLYLEWFKGQQTWSPLTALFNSGVEEGDILSTPGAICSVESFQVSVQETKAPSKNKYIHHYHQYHHHDHQGPGTTSHHHPPNIRIYRNSYTNAGGATTVDTGLSDDTYTDTATYYEYYDDTAHYHNHHGDRTGYSEDSGSTRLPLYESDDGNSMSRNNLGLHGEGSQNRKSQLYRENLAQVVILGEI